MQNGSIIEYHGHRIDLSNLCGGNDYAAITDNYNRDKINELVCSIKDDLDREYVTKAIFNARKIEKCPEEDFQAWEDLIIERNKLQKDYNLEKAKEVPVNISPQLIQEKIKGYNTTESAVFIYFILDYMKIYVKNDEYKNCDQKILIPAMAKTFGFSESSFNDKLNLDFTDSATRKAMKKVANDWGEIMPQIKEEIMRQYEEYEDDFIEKQKIIKKTKKSA